MWNLYTQTGMQGDGGKGDSKLSVLVKEVFHFEKFYFLKSDK